MIVASDLSKSFRTNSGQINQAVDCISFSVSAGEVYGLLGPNGAGKTTTLRMIMGLLSPDSGFATVDGARTDNQSGQKNQSEMVLSKLGMISTNDGVYPWLSVREMLSYFADLYGVPQSLAKTRMAELAELLDIQNVLNQRCSTLSTGQKQRVTFARGLMHDPPVMLLDEPTRGLDVVGSRTVFKFIDLLRQRGKAILLSTHRLDEAERVCDRFGLLHQGTLRYEGTFTELCQLTGRQHLVEMFIDLIDQGGAA